MCLCKFALANLVMPSVSVSGGGERREEGLSGAGSREGFDVHLKGGLVAGLAPLAADLKGGDAAPQVLHQLHPPTTPLTPSEHCSARDKSGSNQGIHAFLRSAAGWPVTSTTEVLERSRSVLSGGGRA